MKLDGIREELVAQLNQPAFQGVLIGCALVYVIVWLKIFRRAGLPPLLGVLMLVPPLTFILPVYMAFTRWPVERPIVRSRQRARAMAQRVVRQARINPIVQRPKTVGLELTAAEMPASIENAYGGRDYVPLRLKPSRMY